MYEGIQHGVPAGRLPITPLSPAERVLHPELQSSQLRVGRAGLFNAHNWIQLHYLYDILLLVQRTSIKHLTLDYYYGTEFVPFDGLSY